MRIETVDVAIVGGSLSGAATAVLLLRGNPRLRILILEKSKTFSRRVGESTVEVSAYFLGRVLGLTSFNNETQLSKQGMRFWFTRPGLSGMTECSEMGGRYLTRIPAWQVDRSVLDEEVLSRAQQAGAQVLRQAKVREIDLVGGGHQTLQVETAEGPLKVQARWVVDASGFASLLARKQGWIRPNRDHPTTACWTRWRGVTDLDGFDLACRHPEWAGACHGIRATATNHLAGDGWWAWVIPLRGGETSVGVVFDQRRVHWPDGPEPLVQRLKGFLCAHPMGRELMEKAEPVEGDIHWRANLAYWSDRTAGDGFVLVGDAAGFIDPLYSPGMDWLSFTSSRAADLILRSVAGEPVEPQVERHNRDFRQSYQHWFEAVYRDKYSWLGDFELMQIGFRLDLGFYYIGVVSQPFRDGARALLNPVFSLPASRVPQWIMRTYNRRLARMADGRRRRGIFGRANGHRRDLLAGFIPDRSSGLPLLGTLAQWLLLEVREGWRTWFSGAVAVPPKA